MNKIYLSGKIIRPPIILFQGRSRLHVVFRMQPEIEKSQTGLPIHAWDDMAEWCMHNLKTGQFVVLHGHLAQRMIRIKSQCFCLPYVEADEFFGQHFL